MAFEKKPSFPLKLLLLLGVSAIGCGERSRAMAEDSRARDAEASPLLVPTCENVPSTAIDPTALVDDMEDRNAAVPAVGGRNGGWWVYADETGGTITPKANAAPSPERIPGGRCGSEYAMRVTGQGFTDWGAGIDVAFRYENDDLGAFDAGAYSGIRFWAKVGEGNTSTVRVQFEDQNTYPVGRMCDPADRVGPSACYNAHGTGVAPLTTHWQLYEIPFDHLSQRDFFGSPTRFETSALYNIEWLVEAGSVFDVWIDDVWFY